jgi:Ca2+-binding RTX toxin-like protein
MATTIGSLDNDILIGTNQSDLIIGLNGDDDLFGLDGDDTIFGGFGDDIITGGARNDIINGDDGNDTIYGDEASLGVAGNDVINGGNGDDVIFSGGGNDIVNGDDGNDILNGEDGNDILNGGNGNDVISGGNGADIFSGGNGNDRIFGDAGDDIITGDAGNDIITGGDGNDIALGGTGNDRFFGGNGNDQFFGEDGNDSANGGAGDDILDGGTGNDTLIGVDRFDPTSGFGLGEIDTLNGGQGRDQFVLGEGTQVYYFGGGNTDYAQISDFNLSQDVIQLAANPATSVPVAESGDAGQTLTSAQVIPGGSGQLDAITGVISSNNDVDIFQISLAGDSFSASTVGGASFDTQLFLFDSSGVLLAQNDDSEGTLQSTISSSSLAAGDYFLAISSFNNDPSGTPPIFEGSGNSTGSYRIDVTGVQAPLASYSLGASPVSSGTGLFFGGDLIADIQGVSPSDLSLNNSNFVLV